MSTAISIAGEEGLNLTEIKENMKRHGKKLAVLATGGGFFLLFIWGSALVVNAAILSAFTTLGFLLIYIKTPRRWKDFIVRHSLFFDALAALLTYLLFGSTVTSLLAAAITGCLTTALLYLGGE